ncbi:SAM-dependent methyltransferase [Sulfurovum lithotrophicum]|uniref:SAM-dependent methyltransferase n=1 Tax=Sulfurovum lithotrophicum TaxID=206403 RepID=A0A7U4M276_9BACT|nr:5-histidylcysteine sulfoxide synthase [Sulfurovum lithotrophicum]AKF25529.1 SAM-dependent methyltransferase [Sulfurovum lithotrophicum]
MELVIQMPALTGDDSELKRSEIKHYFQYCFKRYESLFKTVAKEEAYFIKADPLRHPIIFYYGHTATFFINKLKLAKIIDKRIDAELESIFAVGVDEMSWDDLNEQHYNWPTLSHTQAYREEVYTLVSKLIDTLPLTLPITQDSPWWVILMGVEHENIHLETSSVLIRQLPLTMLQETELWNTCEASGEAPENELLDVAGGRVLLGKGKNADYFGWDNEYGHHEADVPAFKVSRYLVSHAEYLEFVKTGGYENDTFWGEEGIAWRSYTGAKHPLFWIEDESQTSGYRLRTMLSEIPLPMNWPVEVNCLEAEAFCRWLGKKEKKLISLPTEDEYMRLRSVADVPGYTEWSLGTEVPGNIDLRITASSVPVDRYAHNGFYDVVGNVWQWSRTPIYPFEGFAVHPVYDDFTVPTFDGKHNLIKGGSWISCGNLALETSRYAFRRHFYQHAGFRYVESSYDEKVTTNPYTTDSIISQYCHFGWAENRLGVENYPAKCASLIAEYMKEKPKRRAFDIGCAIGRSTFELARHFDEVIGVDFSARFIQEAQKLKESGTLRYVMPTEGELESFHEVSLAQLGLEKERQKVVFWQADACNLKPLFDNFDLIFAGNLLDRLYDPKKFLDSIAPRLNEGGLFVLTSPYTWQEESTPKEKWIGGCKRDGESVSTFEGLTEILEKDFRLIDRRDVPFVIQETARKHQHTIAEMTVWEKQ